MTKNIQVIDGADNCEYAIYAATDDEFLLIFPSASQNVEFIEDLIERIGDRDADEILKRIWNRRLEKASANGIDGTLFYELHWKKKYYPSKNDREMIVPDLSC